MQPRVLLAHNFYLPEARSGEDQVFVDERELLVRSGIEVISYEKRNEDLQAAGLLAKIGAAVRAPWNSTSESEIAELIERSRPTVAHFHNIFPLITPAALRACKRAGVPVVVTLHNFRWRCASGLLLRDGATCEKCWTGSPLNAVVHRCYQESALASLVSVSAHSIQRRSVLEGGLVDRFIALTEFSKRKHVAAGIPEGRIVVKGNCVAADPSPGGNRVGHVLFAGRFGAEKGILTLLEAWRRLGSSAPRLRMLGGGPLESHVRDEVSRYDLNIEVWGPVSRDVVIEGMRTATCVVVPSTCYEGFPLAIAEAMACGTPVIASRTGGLPEMVTNDVNGLIFERADAGSLSTAVAALFSGGRDLGPMYRAARAYYEDNLSPQRTVQQLLEIYRQACNTNASQDMFTSA